MVGGAFAQTPVNSKNGRELYISQGCYSCHNYAGHGGAAGPRLVPMRRTVESFTTFVRAPNAMPPYSPKVLSDAQLADIWAYIRTLPESPAVKEIPLLNQLLRE
jgi:ubiquinol-cytochrome c reductase cytochrome c subunit